MPLNSVNRDLVRSIRPFSKLEDARFADLMVPSSFRQVPARAVLFSEGRSVGWLYVLMHGVVELLSEQDNRRLTVAIVRPIKALLLSSILVRGNPVSARTLEPCKLVAIPAKSVVEALGKARNLQARLPTSWLRS